MRVDRLSPAGQLRYFCRDATRFVHPKAPRSRLIFMMLGYSLEQYIGRLESTLPAGMSFLRARSEGWQIDHIDPLAKIAELPIPLIEQFKFAMRLDNLRMLPGYKNRARGLGDPKEWSKELHSMLSTNPT